MAFRYMSSSSAYRYWNLFYGDLIHFPYLRERSCHQHQILSSYCLQGSNCPCINDFPFSQPIRPH